MAEPFLIRRIDVLLVDLVQELDREYPELPYGLVARCVDVARRSTDTRPRDDEAVDAVALVEQAAREARAGICKTLQGEARYRAPPPPRRDLTATTRSSASSNS